MSTPRGPLQSGVNVASRLTGDRLGRTAGGVVSENPPHDSSFRLVDPAQPVLGYPIPIRRARHHGIAVTATASGPSLLDPATQAAMRLQCQVLEIERIHRPLEPDMQLADLAFGHRHQPHAHERKLLEQPGRALLVA